MKISICLLLILVFFVFCGPKQKGVERLVEDGVQVVINPLEPLRVEGESSNLTLEEEFVIDLENEELAEMGMIDPALHDVDSEGNIYFMQQRTTKDFIFKFDRNGNFAASLGQKGQGPGEIQFPTSLAVNNRDELVIIDTGSRKLILLDKNGGFLKELKLRSNIYAVFPLPDEKYLIYKSLALPESVDAQIIGFILCDAELTELKEVNRLRIPHLNKLEKINGIGESGLFCLSNDGVYFGKTEEGYEIWKYDLDGNLVRKIRKEFRPVPVTEEDKELYMQRWNRLPDEIREKVYFPDFMPPFQAGFVDDEGRLFVMTYERGENPREYVYDLFNPEGIFIGRIKIDNFVLAKRNRIYYYLEKENGYKELVVCQVKWE